MATVSIATVCTWIFSPTSTSCCRRRKDPGADSGDRALRQLAFSRPLIHTVYMLSDVAGKTVTVLELQKWLTNQPHIVMLVDVRNAVAKTVGQIPNSISLDATATPTWLQNTKNQTVVVYCSTGLRSASLVEEWQTLGHSHVVSLIGGFAAWEQAGLPITQHNRYARQMQLPQIGVSGQDKLLQSRVLIIGMGGLGCPVSQYLVASGVGHVGLVDFDKVELSNLQRQILFSESHIGKLKVDCAKSVLQNLNSDVQIITYPVRLTADNARTIIADYDIIVHGTDNFTTRYLVNEICHELRKPLVEGAVQEFGGQVAAFDFRTDGPCYQCVFPSVPPTDARLSCAEIGVLGVLPGMVGVLQATEVLKLILNLGQTLNHKLLIYDGLSATTKTLTLKKNPACPVCNHNPI